MRLDDVLATIADLLPEAITFELLANNDVLTNREGVNAGNPLAKALGAVVANHRVCGTPLPYLPPQGGKEPTE